MSAAGNAAGSVAGVDGDVLTRHAVLDLPPRSIDRAVRLRMLREKTRADERRELCTCGHTRRCHETGGTRLRNGRFDPGDFCRWQGDFAEFCPCNGFALAEPFAGADELLRRLSVVEQQP